MFGGEASVVSRLFLPDDISSTVYCSDAIPVCHWLDFALWQ